MDQHAVDAVLAGDASYDDLPDEEQAAVRAEWDRRIDEIRGALDLEARFVAEGRDSWAEADADGNVVVCAVDEAGNVVRQPTD